MQKKEKKASEELGVDFVFRDATEIKITANDFLLKLKEIDNKIHPQSGVNDGNLSYGNIDRYWFWRLDYY